jgi:hypothetical protein
MTCVDLNRDPKALRTININLVASPVTQHFLRFREDQRRDLGTHKERREGWGGSQTSMP